MQFCFRLNSLFDERKQQLLDQKEAVCNEIMQQLDKQLQSCLWLLCTILQQQDANNPQARLILSQLNELVIEIMTRKIVIIAKLDIVYQNGFEALFFTQQTINNFLVSKLINICKNSQSPNSKKSLKKELEENCSIFYSFNAKNGGNYQCNLCKNYKKKCLNTIMNHLQKQHYKQYEQMTKKLCMKYYKTIAKSDENNNTKKTFRQCKICNTKITEKRREYLHLTSHKYPNYKAKVFQCHYCLLIVTSNCKLQSHLLIHRNQRPFECNVCNKCFRTKQHLRRHIRIHTGEKPYRCHFKNCNKRYNQKTALTIHLRSHTNEKPYICNFDGCGKRYGSRRCYRDHMAKHNGTYKKHVCELCNATLTTRKALNSHLVNVHKTMKHLIYQCDICGKRSQTQWGIKVHKKHVHDVSVFVPIQRNE